MLLLILVLYILLLSLIHIYSIAASFIQLIGYGTGFWRAWWNRCIPVSYTHLDVYKRQVQAYTKRAYASVPLRQYAEDGLNKITVYFSINTYSGKEATYEFEYNP